MAQEMTPVEWDALPPADQERYERICFVSVSCGVEMEEAKSIVDGEQKSLFG